MAAPSNEMIRLYRCDPSYSRQGWQFMSSKSICSRSSFQTTSQSGPCEQLFGHPLPWEGPRQLHASVPRCSIRLCPTHSSPIIPVAWPALASRSGPINSLRHCDCAYLEPILLNKGPSPGRPARVRGIHQAMLRLCLQYADW